MNDPLTPVVLQYWERRVARGDLAPGTAARCVRILASFTRYLSASGATLADTDARLCRAFVSAALVGGRQPADSTSRFRLTVIRDAFRGLVEAGEVTTDPTAGLRVAQGPQARGTFPLTPHEAHRLRAAGRLSPRDHLRPAVVELALIGASHAQISKVVVTDLDLGTGAVRLDGRVVLLDPFAVSTMRARVAACRRITQRKRKPWEPDSVSVALSRPLSSYPATSIAPTISSSLSRAMHSAGLTRAGLRPASIREYAANRCYALQGRVESVAALLGVSSLDVAHRFIDQTWQDTYGEKVRASDRG